MATIQITAQDFKDKIFDYKTPEGCGARAGRTAEQFKAELDIYKINTNEEAELSALFGIQSFPMFFVYAGKRQSYYAAGRRARKCFFSR